MNVSNITLYMVSLNYQKVLSGKRVTLSENICKKYNIKEGDIVIVEDDDVIKITPAQVIKRSVSSV